jgi:hypothetical protein
MENVEVKKVRKRRASVFDAYRDEIIEMLKLKSSATFVTKEINKEGKVNVSVDGLIAYIKREKLRDVI